MRDPRTVPFPRAPLPQTERPEDVTTVRVTDGFFQQLPPSTLMFFDRTFVARVPKPLQAGAAASPYPRQLTIVAFQVPARQVLVVRDVVFTGFTQGGIDPQDVTPVDSKRLVNFVTYAFRVADRAPTDFNTNVGGALSTSNQTEFVAIAGAGTMPQNQSPFGGSIKDKYTNFATYARPSQNVVLAYTLLQPPKINVVQFSAELSGYILEEVHFDRMIRKVR